MGIGDCEFENYATSLKQGDQVNHDIHGFISFSHFSLSKGKELK